MNEHQMAKIYIIWVDGGYGDQWQMTASIYGGGLWIQVYSKYQATLKADVFLHVFGV